MGKYNGSFTSGALMLHESKVIIPLLLAADTEGVSLEIAEGHALKINALSSRKRKVGEISKRFKAVNRVVWERFVEADTNEQYLILYYACLKTYEVLRDFQIDVLLRKWKTGSLDFDKYIFMDFLFRQRPQHSEIEDWTSVTCEKLGQVLVVMLTELGLLKNGRLQELHFDDRVWSVFIKIRATWFLEALFLDDLRRQELVETVI
jgi:hypothetical protein